MKRNERILSFIALVVVAVVAFGLSNATFAHEPKDHLALVLKHMTVPEPIDLIFWDSPKREHLRGFLPKRATIEYDKYAGHWVLVLNRNWWDDAPYYSRLSTLAHEVCHAAYDHDVLIPDLWYALPNDELERRQTRAERCSVQILRRIQDGR
jgi:hypothetical protein